MKIILAIPTGDRTERAVETAWKWYDTGAVKIVAYAWDDKTAKALKPFCKKIFRGFRKPFGVLQNYMAMAVKKWDVFICGADDLWPEEGTELIGPAAREVDGNILWVKDGLFNAQPTHPIITRGWYDKHGKIFDEGFMHNFCDTDLFVRASMAQEVVKCFDIAFDHQHWLKTKQPKDMIYDAGQRHWGHDKQYFQMKHSKFLNTHGADIPQIRTLDIVNSAVC